MFDVENAIHAWKQKGQRAENVTQADMEELEEHLRESISHFVGKGLTEQEAFLVASIRLGEPAVLSDEYAKVNGSTVLLRRVHWMVFGYVGGIALASGISGLSSCIGALSAYLGYDGTPAGLAGAITGIATWATVVVLLYSRTQRDDATSRNELIPSGWLVSLVVLMVTGTGVGLVATNLHAQLVPADQYGVSIWWATLGGLVVKWSIIALGIGLVVTIRRRFPQQPELKLD